MYRPLLAGALAGEYRRRFRRWPAGIFARAFPDSGNQEKVTSAAMEKGRTLFEARRSSSQGYRDRSFFNSAVFLRATESREQTDWRVSMMVGRATHAEAQPMNCFNKFELSPLAVSTCAARSVDVDSRHGDTQAPRQTALPVQALRNTRRSRRLRVDEAMAGFLFPRCLFAFDSQRRGMRASWR
jgi:hypothetical protein